MLIEEAKWLGRQLATIPPHRLSPMLNAGSQTLHFRQFVQPWMEQYVFAPLKARGVRVVHTDLRPGAGVDIVGDLRDDEFLHRLQAYGFRSLFCSNLLEHVPQPDRLAGQLVRILPVGGLLFVSCPRAFPYHPDPIDTGFRPDVEHLASLFPQTRLVVGEIVDCGPLWHYFLARFRAWCREHRAQATPASAAGMSSRDAGKVLQPSEPMASDQQGLATPAPRTSNNADDNHRQDKNVQAAHPQDWRRVLELAGWLCRPVSATCAVLEVVPVWRPSPVAQQQPCAS